MGRKRNAATALEAVSGGPLFKGTRVPVKALFDYIRRGERLADFLRDFPGVRREQALQALEVPVQRNDSAFKFERKVDLDRLALSQGVQTITDFDSLLGDFWPEDEAVDDFISQLRLWRSGLILTSAAP